MYAPTANGAAAGREREQTWITSSSPKVAIPSLNAWARPERACVEAARSGSPNIAFAAATPANAPATCTAT